MSCKVAFTSHCPSSQHALVATDGELKRARGCVVQGLIHISELSWSVVLTPDAVVQPGGAVRCKVKRVDREKGQIQLSLKARGPAAALPGFVPRAPCDADMFIVMKFA